LGCCSAGSLSLVLLGARLFVDWGAGAARRFAVEGSWRWGAARRGLCRSCCSARGCSWIGVRMRRVVSRLRARGIGLLGSRSGGALEHPLIREGALRWVRASDAHPDPSEPRGAGDAWARTSALRPAVLYDHPRWPLGLSRHPGDRDRLLERERAVSTYREDRCWAGGLRSRSAWRRASANRLRVACPAHAAASRLGAPGSRIWSGSAVLSMFHVEHAPGEHRSHWLDQARSQGSWCGPRPRTP